MAKKILPPITGLTDSFLRSLKPQKTRFEIADPQTHGLRIRVTPTGKIIFVWYYRDTSTGKNKVLALGTYGHGHDAITLLQARELLSKAKIKHEAGDFALDKKAPVTVSELADEFYLKRIEPKLRRPEVVRKVLDNDIVPVIGNKKLLSLTVTSLNQCIDKVVERGSPVHAARVLACLKQMFKYGEGRGYIDRSPGYALDPVNFGITKNVRERWLKTEEIKPVWDAISDGGKLSLSVKNALKILMLTGTRTGELMKAEWQHIDFDKAEWFIPKQNTKTLSEWIVPLTAEVTALLQELQGIDKTFVFPGKNGMLTDKTTGRAMKRLFESGLLIIEPIVPHDFRRTIRTHLEQLGVQPHICEKVLNHSLGSINFVYNKNSYLPERRQALQRWTEFVMTQVNQESKVTHIKNA